MTAGVTCGAMAGRIAGTRVEAKVGTELAGTVGVGITASVEGDEANVGAKGSGVAKEVVVTLAGGFGIVVAKTIAGAILIVGKADRGGITGEA